MTFKAIMHTKRNQKLKKVIRTLQKHIGRKHLSISASYRNVELLYDNILYDVDDMA